MEAMADIINNTNLSDMGMEEALGYGFGYGAAGYGYPSVGPTGIIKILISAGISSALLHTASSLRQGIGLRLHYSG